MTSCTSMQLTPCGVWVWGTDVSDQLPPERLLPLGIRCGLRSSLVNFKAQADSHGRVEADGGHKLETEDARVDNRLDKEPHVSGGLLNPVTNEEYRGGVGGWYAFRGGDG